MDSISSVVTDLLGDLAEGTLHLRDSNKGRGNEGGGGAGRVGEESPSR